MLFKKYRDKINKFQNNLLIILFNKILHCKIKCKNNLSTIKFNHFNLLEKKKYLLKFNHQYKIDYWLIILILKNKILNKKLE